MNSYRQLIVFDRECVAEGGDVEWDAIKVAVLKESVDERSHQNIGKLEVFADVEIGFAENCFNISGFRFWY